jgi:PAS domain S-box-containing protein
MSNENRYKQLFVTARHGILILYADTGEIADVNPFFTELTGYTYKNIIGKSLYEIDIFKEIHEFKIFFIKSQSNKCFRHDNLTLFTADRREIPVELTANIYSEENKKMIRCIIRDISRRNNMEEALIDSETRYRNLFEHSCEAIVVSGHDGRIINANPAAVKMFGLKTREDIIGKSTIDVYAYPRQREVIFKELDTKGYAENFEIELVKQDGSGQHIFTLVNAVFHKNEQGEILRSEAMIIDITQRKQAEEALRQSIENFRALAEDASDGIVIATGEEARYVYANKRAGEITGYNIDELLKKRPGDLISPEEYPKIHERYRKRIAGLDVIKPYETTLINKDGTKIQVEMSPSKTVWHKEPADMIIFRDITKRKRFEHELKLSRDVLRNLSMHIEEAREKERTKIATNLHDDLGQMLTALNIDLGWLEENLSELQPELLDKINAMKELLLDSIERIRSISTELRPSILDDLGLAEAVEWHLEELKKLTGIYYELDITPEEFKLAPEISIIVFRIVQEILTNITRHANATLVRINLARDEKTVRLEATDNGRGIKKAEIDDPKSFGIIGMRERVISFGGSFRIGGAKGKGTKVLVEIPIPNTSNK